MVPWLRVVALALLASAFSGCVTGDVDDTKGQTLTSLDVYEYRFSGDDVAFRGVPYGHVARLTNPTDTTVSFRVTPLHPDQTEWGPAGLGGWSILTEPTTMPLAAGDSVVYLFRSSFPDHPGKTGFILETVGDTQYDRGVQTTDVLEEATFEREVKFNPPDFPVSPGEHVQTATVGIWLNGTSFYTNIPDLMDDPDFHLPDGSRATFNGDPLSIYVYDQDRSEQPAGSKDTCHSTTITGYNELLKTQIPTGTNVRYLAPEEAYTLPGYQEHWLYGEALIFLNTVVVREDRATVTGMAPDPTGACFRPEHALPPLPVQPDPTATTAGLHAAPPA